MNYILYLSLSFHYKMMINVISNSISLPSNFHSHIILLSYSASISITIHSYYLYYTANYLSHLIIFLYTTH